MNIYISTNLYPANELEQIFQLMERIQDEAVGIELFPEWHDSRFADTLSKNLDRFKAYPSALHGPYYYTEHAKKKGCTEYETAKAYFIKTLELAKELNSKYIVYHHNNCPVNPENRDEILKNSVENLLELDALAKDYHVAIVVENAGVLSRGNMLFDESQFIELAKNMDNRILIDIGHAFANNWNLDYVISALKDKIVSYHLHNNDGVEDHHNRIRDGKFNINDFFESYKKYTPKADLVIEYGKGCREDMEGILKDVYEIRETLGLPNLCKGSLT
ncbi:sugar phosphate isomerase/epimerase family protein [Geosporobacter ferrireducens]|uniref:Sugar phosphate isomerase n=1 Tax=Geosporobacter ferrireducens TaxID=1424294 RepID=A0A1D8GKP5_9FIRM|nr:sugar phosphate isomerase/epimerase [Geosporobacter ferrireducens]AOT71480.1 sugar phosphate isomerase [Geosporobacter ferrireducens]MTI57790.1 sugar phosphate isomerase/epimerase [Geosporobacter ferrireducens]